MTDAAADRVAESPALSTSRGRLIGILIPTAWLLLFFAIPFLFVIQDLNHSHERRGTLRPDRVAAFTGRVD